MNSKTTLFTCNGFPFPFGISAQEEGVNFAIPSTHAKKVSLCLFDRETLELTSEIPLSTQSNKTGNVWHVLVYNLSENMAYAYRIDGSMRGTESPSIHQCLLSDPYAKNLATKCTWGKKNSLCELQPYFPLCDIILKCPFDWDNDHLPRIPINELIIYEMHVRGFTQDSSSNVKHPGTFLGVIEKIPYLKSLGINAIELLPIQEFNELEYQEFKEFDSFSSSETKPLYNYWGYSTANFFSPMNRYATNDLPGIAVKEFKMLAKELHRHQIEIILDVVFNHTSEGGEQGPVLSFKGIDNSIYYMCNPEGSYFNFSGCGNTFNCNHPLVLEQIITCLRYWVTEMHVDGFRFDLASILKRGPDGIPIPHAPLIEAITADPILADVKLIAEPWDAAGLYEVGNFSKSQRWSEWNGKYRDSIRRFIKGIPETNGEFAMRLCGSEDLYFRKNPCCSINFVTTHDGFTLADLVSYNVKHNLKNGENNRDGENHNDSWNCGVEGETVNRNILALRERQMRNLHLALMISQGVPLLLMGDEYGHTKKGNNNTWCQDNQLNWFLWNKVDLSEGFSRFFRMLIHFRKTHPQLQRTSFLSDQDIEWHGTEPFKPQWNKTSFIAFTVRDHAHNRELYVAFNAHGETIAIQIPDAPDTMNWHWVVNTANNSPSDIYNHENAPKVLESSYKMHSYSAILLEADRA